MREVISICMVYIEVRRGDGSRNKGKHSVCVVHVYNILLLVCNLWRE